MEKSELKNMEIGITEPGSFVVGCNYWASNAGLFMWSDWQPPVVEEDLRLLSENGMQVLRVFPLWPDFQPITQLYGHSGHLREIRWGERTLSSDDAGQAGVSTEAMDKFTVLADLAAKYDLKLVVGLITGWMSGRLFVPPALEGRNILTDPVAVMWQTRFVRYFVRRFKNHPAVVAWDLGNECNCLASASSREEAWCWTAGITHAIRAEDPSRPVISGMHGLVPDSKGPWTIADQGELTDMLTTHPYPIFTPHCGQDPLNTMRSCLHATAESLYYSDIAGKPCMAEEIGTLGSMIAGERVAGDYMRTNLFSLWAHNCAGALWWCAFDQNHLDKAPYDWDSHERELGMFRNDRSGKPVLEEFRAFRNLLRDMPALPPRRTEAVCILTGNQDQWAAAYSTFVLAKQAGFDVRFQSADQPLKEAGLYLLPSVKGSNAASRHFWMELLERIRGGATLYLSHDDCLLSPFNEVFGLEVQTRERRTEPARISIAKGEDRLDFRAFSPYKLSMRSTTARVLGREEDGTPAFTCNDYGKGRIYFLVVPIEMELSTTPGAFHSSAAQPFWRIYQKIARPFISQRVIGKENPLVGVTEHVLPDGRCAAVLINYSPDTVETAFRVNDGWSLGQCLHGQVLVQPNGEGRVRILGSDAVVMVLQ